MSNKDEKSKPLPKSIKSETKKPWAAAHRSKIKSSKKG